MDIAAMIPLAGKGMLALAAALSLWFMARGLMDMQRVNTADPDVLELQGIIRQLTPRGRYDMQAVVTIQAEDEVKHVDCLLPGGWLKGRKRQVTDFVRVYWRRGDARAVAVQSVRDGQIMFIIGILALAVSGLLALLLFR
ncbi:MAG: hypothetical protein IKK57_00585 [Clostridia bacterium]|nr:hypothetical protein [Clostridia bacterium]